MPRQLEATTPGRPALLRSFPWLQGRGRDKHGKRAHSTLRFCFPVQRSRLGVRKSVGAFCPKTGFESTALMAPSCLPPSSNRQKSPCDGDATVAAALGSRHRRNRSVAVSRAVVDMFNSSRSVRAQLRSRLPRFNQGRYHITRGSSRIEGRRRAPPQLHGSACLGQSEASGRVRRSTTRTPLPCKSATAWTLSPAISSSSRCHHRGCTRL